MQAMRSTGQRVNYSSDLNRNNMFKNDIPNGGEFFTEYFCNILPLFAIKISRAVFCKR